MALLFRYSDNPLEKGFIVTLFKTCGKANCRCITQGKKHISYALKYWEYDYCSHTRKQKMIYLKKLNVRRVQRILAISIGKQMMFGHDSIIFDIAQRYPDLSRDEL